MIKLLKYVLHLFLLLAVILIVFYFWASSPQYNVESYGKIVEYNKSAVVTNDSIFTIATYNIGYLSGLTNNKAIERPKALFESNLNRVKGVFKNIKADFIAFQEIDYAAKRSYFKDQQKELAGLGYRYAAQSVNWDKTYVPFPYWPPSMHFGKVLSGQSVLSKYKIIEHKRIVLDRVEDMPFWQDAFYLDRLMQIVTILVGSNEIKLINVHLEAYDRKTRAKHTGAVIIAYKKLSEKYPTLLVGDFNSDPDFENATIQAFLDLPNTACAVSDLSQNTFPSKRSKKRLDYIFYNTRFIEKISARIITETQDASDHLPVMMQFKLK